MRFELELVNRLQNEATISMVRSMINVWVKLWQHCEVLANVPKQLETFINGFRSASLYELASWWYNRLVDL